jgi:hypothetical protein
MLLRYSGWWKCTRHKKIIDLSISVRYNLDVDSVYEIVHLVHFNAESFALLVGRSGHIR